MGLDREKSPNIGADDCLKGGGQMGELMRSHDWASTPLGPIEGWPQSLRTSVSICLNSAFALLVWWGSELVMLYNDAYGLILGEKHPNALGMAGKQCWPEIWSIIGPMLQEVIEQGLPLRADDLYLPLVRKGYSEECYFTFSYSAIRDESGGVGGIFTPVQETTEKVIGERRLRTLRDLAAQSTVASVNQACEVTISALARNPKDVPFVSIYLLDASDGCFHLAGASGIEPGSRLVPNRIQIREPRSGGVEGLVSRAFASLEFTTLEVTPDMGPLPFGAWERSPRAIFCSPICLPGSTRLAGLVLGALSPMRVLDDSYRGFLNLLTGQISANLASARAREDERRMITELAELDLANSRFFSNASHELRTPLTLILGQLEAALQSASDTSVAVDRAALEMAHRNGLRLLKLVNTVLDFSRIEAGRLKPEREPLDLALLTVELANNFRSALDRAGILFAVECEPLAGPVLMDRGMWEKIVLNLVSNALKFTERGEVAVQLRQYEDSAVLTVRDTGIGIAPDQLAHVFERFQRVEGVHARTHEGTGIGLALVRELAELLGGKAKVESEPGTGSTFTIRVPLEPAPPGAAAESGNGSRASSAYLAEALQWLPGPSVPPGVHEPRPYSDASEARGHVLIVDDNADMREYVANLLSDAYRVSVAAEGRTALVIAREQRPDLIISDVMMSIMDGFELVNRLRDYDETRGIPVILLSARAGDEARLEGIETLADDYVAKPFSGRELQARVRAHIERSRLRHSAASTLYRSEEQTRAVFDYAPIGIALVDRNGRFERTNRALQGILGRAEEELAATTLAEVTAPQDRAGTHARLAALFAGELVQPLREKQYVGGSGEAIWVRESLAALRDPAGVARHVIVLTENVTAEKRAEQEKDRLLEELTLHRSRLTSLFEQAPAFTAVVRGPEHRFEMANPLFFDLVGHREVVGKTVREALPEVEGQGFFELLDEIYQTAKPFSGRRMRVRLQRVDGGDLEPRYVSFIYQQGERI